MMAIMKATAMPLPIPLGICVLLKNLTITNPIGKLGFEQLANASRQI
jgi:hypothetical protein